MSSKAPKWLTRRRRPWHHHRVSCRDAELQAHRARKLEAAFRRYGSRLPDGFYVWKTGASLEEVRAARLAPSLFEQDGIRVPP
jgi:hypothetical protein